MLDTLEKAALACANSLQTKGKIFFAGNGGSAADAQHLAAELVCRYTYDRPAMAGIALTTDTSAITAIANDYCYEDLFARQLAGLAREGDVFVGISTSGNSENILRALKLAQENGIKTIGLTGKDGGQMTVLCDYLLIAPGSATATIQECHIVLGHLLGDIMQAHCYGK